MTLKEFCRFKRVLNLELARETGRDPSRISMFLNGWITLPEGDARKIATFLGITEQEVKSNRVHESRKKSGRPA